MKIFRKFPLSFFLTVVALLLSSCTVVRQREDPALLQTQEQREAILLDKKQWVITARIAVSDGKDSGSGQMEWHQDDESYEFHFRAPVTGKTWRLYGDANSAVLEGAGNTPFRGGNAEQLLQEKLGWHVPMAQLAAWVRALRAPGSRAELSYNEQNLPAVLKQAGWKVEYKDYFTDRTPALPRKVFASKKNYRVKMVIQEWKLSSTNE